MWVLYINRAHSHTARAGGLRDVRTSALRVNINGDLELRTHGTEKKQRPVNQKPDERIMPSQIPRPSLWELGHVGSGKWFL